MLADCTCVWMLRTEEPDKPAFESAAIRQHPNFEHWRQNSCVVSMSDIRMCNEWFCVSSAWPGQKYASSTKPSIVSEMSSKPIVCHQSSDPFQFNLSSISYHTKDGPLRWPGETIRFQDCFLASKCQVHIVGKGLPPQTIVELRADLRRKEDKIHFSSRNRWYNHIHRLCSISTCRYLTSCDGTIDTRQQEPVSGSYVGVHRWL